MRFLPGGSGTTIRNNTTQQIHISHKVTHHAQTKHSTQSYTNNKGHITHNEYNTKVKLSPYQAGKPYGAVRRRGSHIVQTVRPQMAVKDHSQIQDYSSTPSAEPFRMFLRDFLNTRLFCVRRSLFPFDPPPPPRSVSSYPVSCSVTVMHTLLW
jgi:hypothetical protein